MNIKCKTLRGKKWYYVDVLPKFLVNFEDKKLKDHKVISDFAIGYESSEYYDGYRFFIRNWDDEVDVDDEFFFEYPEDLSRRIRADEVGIYHPSNVMENLYKHYRLRKCKHKKLVKIDSMYSSYMVCKKCNIVRREANAKSTRNKKTNK